MNTAQRNFEKVCEILEKNENNPARLIPILQEVQEEYRYLPEEIMTFLATSLDIPPAKVYGVATFFSHFALKPKGKYIIKICDGTACHVKKSTSILDAVRHKLGLTEDKNTTPDMLFTLELVSCLGACGLAPAVVINEDVHGLMTPAKTVALIDEILKKEASL
ncbi:MAG: NAD(P)H-dependent oxidoreductase subunit E [Candidatus Brocadiae bacterium]|nr:NAD(P)H-dependent oxidoreductase subunit E [Candidatus Brocadiia bacterium]